MTRMRAIYLSLTALIAPSMAHAQPLLLDDHALDAVTAGQIESTSLFFQPAVGLRSSGVFLFRLSEVDVSNTSTVMLNVDPVPCPTCYLNIYGELTIQAQFGPP